MINRVLKFFGYAKVTNPDAENSSNSDFSHIQMLSTDYFENASPDMIDYLENLAYNSLRERKESHYRLREDCRKTLSLLLSGLGLLFGLTVTLLAKENVNAPAITTLVLGCVWLFICCIYLLQTGIQTIKQPPVYPDPDIFYDGWVRNNKIGLLESRKRYLPALQYDIQRMIAINTKVSEHLNRVRLLAACTPALLTIFVIALAF